MNFAFYLREALSDVAGMKVLGPYADSRYPTELDYQLAASQSIEQVDTFLSPASLPSVAQWQPGNYTLDLQVVNGLNVAFTVELWRADLSGNDLQIIGARAAIQEVSGAAPINPIVTTFTVNDPTGSSLNKSDRLKLKLFAQNNDSVNAQEFSVLCSVSTLETEIPVPQEFTNQFNTFRRGRFLGYIPRDGEGFGWFDANGVNLYPDPF